jgi:SAM-dependent methyltransferase
MTGIQKSRWATGRDARHALLAELASPWRGWLVDLGCGDGATLVGLLQRTGGAGRVLGLDRDARALARAAGKLRTSGGEIGFVRAELSMQVPLASSSVDRVVCHNVMECVPDPAALLAEIARILRPGGRAVIGHSDYDTMVFAGAELSMTRRMVHAFCDTQQAWMDAVDGTIGRRLPALVASSPLRVDHVQAQVLLEDAFVPDSTGFALASGAASVAVRAAACTQAEAEGWLESLHDAHSQGQYLFSVNDYLVVTTKLEEPSLDGYPIP